MYAWTLGVLSLAKEEHQIQCNTATLSILYGYKPVRIALINRNRKNKT